MASCSQNNAANTADTANDHVRSVNAINEVFADGQKVTAIAVEYDKNINNAKLSQSDYTVKGKTITKVYA